MHRIACFACWFLACAPDNDDLFEGFDSAPLVDVLTSDGEPAPVPNDTEYRGPESPPTIPSTDTGAMDEAEPDRALGPAVPDETPSTTDEAERAPEVLSIEPSDGATGVASDASIVVTFSVPMDRASTEAAYLSEDLPADSVSLSWSDDDTVLSIVPRQPLEVASGDATDEVVARVYAVGIQASAESASGQPISDEVSSEFSVVRRLTASLEAIKDRDLTGSFRADGTYGTRACARGAENTCVGDSRSSENVQYKGFVSFDLGLAAESLRIDGAQLSFSPTDMTGSPFETLGSLVLELASFDAIDSVAFDASPMAEVASTRVDLEGDESVEFELVDVLGALRGPRAQFRLRFERASDFDGEADALISDWDTHRLRVSYLVP